jgi:hypothetical protein
VIAGLGFLILGACVDPPVDTHGIAIAIMSVPIVLIGIKQILIALL